METSTAQRATRRALLAALLFASAVPIAKMLLDELQPVALAGLLYLGSGLAAAGFSLVRRPSSKRHRLSAAERLWLAGAVVAGGFAAPVCLLWGLTRISAAAASLLMSLEAPATAVLAALFFREHVNARVLGAVALVAAGATCAGWSGSGAGTTQWLGVLAVGTAALLWALDNNFTREVAYLDPVTVAAVKGFAAGSVNLGLAVAGGAPLSGSLPLAGALVTGAVCYGASLALYVVALRDLGSARTGAYFATAPFLGAILSVALMGDPVGLNLVGAGILMAAGTAILFFERHDHLHHHEELEHAHRHVHDEHHRHLHSGSEGDEPHTHRHRHDELTHAHPHLPDIHHRHSH